ncbi:MAG: hypothetical protein AAF196_11055 [Planctomycetota bacterium]
MGPVSTTQTQSEHRLESPTELRQCPSLPGAEPSLFVHRIHSDQCQKRREQHFHRCFRCVHRGECGSSDAAATTGG